MANKKNNKNKQTTQKVKIKTGELSTTLSIVIPIVLIFGFLVGGLLLFIYLEESNRLPDQRYLDAERIVKNNELIGLTLVECRDIAGVAMLGPDGEEGDWVFLGGRKEFSNGEGTRVYEIVAEHENGVVVSAVLREIS